MRHELVLRWRFFLLNAFTNVYTEAWLLFGPLLVQGHVLPSQTCANIFCYNSISLLVAHPSQYPCQEWCPLKNSSSSRIILSNTDNLLQITLRSAELLILVKLYLVGVNPSPSCFDYYRQSPYSRFGLQSNYEWYKIS